MSEEEARKFIDRVFAESPVIDGWRKRANEERRRQADLLESAVNAHCRSWAETVAFLNGGISREVLEKARMDRDAAWKAYKESL